jgi:tripartite-type tricarboxylate transporter receptor subunit TctC
MQTLRKMLYVLSLGLVAAGMQFAARPAAAQESDHVVRIVVPWAAGGFTDVFGRLLAEKLAKITNQSVIVDNRPGASGSIGANYVARAKPDGNTLLLSTSDAFVYAVNSDANPNPTYDPIKDFSQISLMATQPVLFAVGKQVPAQTLKEFVEYAKKKNGAVTFGSSGEGSAVHLAMELFSSAAGIKLVHVPYKGINPALLDVLAGRVDAILISVQGAGNYIKTGELRPLAISSLQRSPLEPAIPTIAESGYPGFEVTLWYGLCAPKGTPPAIIDKWNKAVQQALQDPELRNRLTEANTTPIGTSPAQADAFLQQQLARWTQAVQAARAGAKAAAPASKD